MKKYPFFIILIVTSMIFIRCGNKGEVTDNSPSGAGTESGVAPTGNKIKITVGTTVFPATLYTNQSAHAFRAMLPLTLNMSDLNANEKLFYFSAILPTNASAGGEIQVGDIMLYGNNCLVLFYKGFNTTYSYSRLGRIDNVPGYAAALGSRDVLVKFEGQ